MMQQSPCLISRLRPYGAHKGAQKYLKKKFEADMTIIFIDIKLLTIERVRIVYVAWI